MRLAGPAPGSLQVLGTAAAAAGGPESFGKEGRGLQDVYMKCLTTLKGEVSEEVDSTGDMEASRGAESWRVG
mgnify:CR=1 FL=1